MVFADQVITRRRNLGKETVLTIRGETRTEKDVQKYFKRRKLPPGAFSPVPGTPPGIFYSTPMAQSPMQTQVQIVPRLFSPQSSRSLVARCRSPPSLLQIHSETRLDKEDDVPEWIPHLSKSSILSPGAFRGQEIIIHCTSAFFNAYLDPLRSPSNDYTMPKAFAQAINVIGTHSDFGACSYGARLAECDLQKLIPRLWSNQPFDFVMDLIIHIFRLRAEGAYANSVATSLQEVTLAYIRASCSNSHPIITILSGLMAPWDLIRPLIRSFLNVGEHLLSSNLSTCNGDFRLSRLLQLHSELSCHWCESDEILSNSRKSYDLALRRHGHNPGPATFTVKVSAELFFIDFLIGHKNYQVAEDMVMKGLDDCLMHDYPIQDLQRGQFLYLQGYLKNIRGQLKEALNAYEEALSLFISARGPHHYQSAYTANKIGDIVKQMEGLSKSDTFLHHSNQQG